MRHLLLSILIASLSAGCASHQPKQVKSRTHIYDGDSPTIHMQTTQSAGGALDTY